MNVQVRDSETQCALPATTTLVVLQSVNLEMWCSEQCGDNRYGTLGLWIKHMNFAYHSCNFLGTLCVPEPTFISMIHQKYLYLYFILQQSKIHTTSITGSLQVAILQFTSNTLTVHVLQGINLAARDFPSLLSDPYVLVSIVPDWNRVGALKSPIINGESLRFVMRWGNHRRYDSLNLYKWLGVLLIRYFVYLS